MVSRREENMAKTIPKLGVSWAMRRAAPVLHYSPINQTRKVQGLREVLSVAWSKAWTMSSVLLKVGFLGFSPTKYSRASSCDTIVSLSESSKGADNFSAAGALL